MKTCSGCLLEKNEDLFSKSSRHSSGLNPRCKSCNSLYRKQRVTKEREYRRNHRKNNPEKYRLSSKRKYLKLHYGITLEQYETMLNKQQGKCCICNSDLLLVRGVVDHDHRCCSGPKTCGKCIRGILCSNCNSGIGLLLDDYQIVQRAAEYLRVPDEE